MLIFCPDCGGVIFRFQNYNEGFENDNFYVDCYGECQDCGKAYRWTDIYRYDETTDIEEVDKAY